MNQSKIVELELAYDVLLYAVHKSVQIVYRFQSQVILRVLFRVHPPNLSVFEQESQRLVELAWLLAHWGLVEGGALLGLDVVRGFSGPVPQVVFRIEHFKNCVWTRNRCGLPHDHLCTVALHVRSQLKVIGLDWTWLRLGNLDECRELQQEKEWSNTICYHILQ